MPSGGTLWRRDACRLLAPRRRATLRDASRGDAMRRACRECVCVDKFTFSYLSFQLKTLLVLLVLFVDVDVYYNLYSNFIAQIEASVPNTSDNMQIPSHLFDRNKQSRYRLWTNSKTIVRNYGAEVDFRYVFNKQYSLLANSSYQTLQKSWLNQLWSTHSFYQLTCSRWFTYCSAFLR